jgi:hypothetical protein
MNAYKFNSTAALALRLAISKSLNIPYRSIYITVKDIDNENIYTKDGKKYLIQLIEIANDEHKKPETERIS